MLDYLKKKYQELIGSVLDPIFAKLLALSWWKRFSLLLLLTAIWGLWEFRAIVREQVGFASRAFVVALAAPGALPLSETLHTQSVAIARRLRATCANDVNLIAPGELTGWSASQTLAAIAEDTTYEQNHQVLVKYIRTRQLPDCHCWAELNTETAEKSWIFISGWVLSALAQVRSAATRAELESLFNEQNPDGSWPPTRGATSTEYESTYATAWVMIGLASQINAKLLSPDLADRAKEAVARAAVWLLEKRQPSGARWKPYPNLASSSSSGSVSGLALHALHVAGTENLRELDREWLGNIPKIAVPASVGENSYVEIKHGTTVVQIDHFVQLTMPWMLIATVDAYRDGSIWERTHAVTWIESLLRHDSVRNADTEQNSWWRAELSVAMNLLVAASR